MIWQHDSTVNAVVLDSKEEYVGSCGDDGKVTLFGLCESAHDQVIEFNRPIKCIELEPNFAQTFGFVTGDTKVLCFYKISSKFLETHLTCNSFLNMKVPRVYLESPLGLVIKRLE